VIGFLGCGHQPPAVVATHAAPVVSRGVAGVVFDSLSGHALPGARVQLVDATHPALPPSTLISDSAGAFAVPDIAPGRYMATFYHPRLDSLGIRSATLLLDLRDAKGMWLDLAIPSVSHLRAVMCGARAATDSGGMMMGRVLDARTRAPLDAALVTGEWLNPSLVTRRDLRAPTRWTQTVSRSDGTYALCGIPTTTDISVRAELPAKTSGIIAVRGSPGGILTRDFYLADSQRVTIRGNVVNVEGGPIAHAHVTVPDAHVDAMSDMNGVFSLTVDRGGTQTIVARAIGFYPEERSIDILPDTVLWVELHLPTMLSVLDTVHVRGRRLTDDASGFDARRAAGVGTFLTPTDIAARVPRTAADLVERSPSTPLIRLPDGHLGVRVRGSPCLPTLVLDGQTIPLLLDLSEIDEIVELSRIARMEIYSAGEVPPIFMRGLPCAAVVVWSKR